MSETKNNNARSKKVAVGIAAGVLAFAGIRGTSAFFTDQAHTDAKAEIGTMNMEVTDLSDLDGDYSANAYAADGTYNKAQNAIGAAAKDTKIDGLTGDNYAVTAAITRNAADQESFDRIINPGNIGLLQFKVANTAEKSFKTALKTTVKIDLADGAIADAECREEE